MEIKGKVEKKEKTEITQTITCMQTHKRNESSVSM